MADKKNLCAMISTELHAKVIEEKERLEMNTLGDYMEMILKEHFEGGKITIDCSSTFMKLSLGIIVSLIILFRLFE